MTAKLNDDLPDALKGVRTRPTFVMRLDVRPLQVVGATPARSAVLAWSRAVRSKASACRVWC